MEQHRSFLALFYGTLILSGSFGWIDIPVSDSAEEERRRVADHIITRKKLLQWLYV